MENGTPVAWICLECFAKNVDIYGETAQPMCSECGDTCEWLDIEWSHAKAQAHTYYIEPSDNINGLWDIFAKDKDGNVVLNWDGEPFCFNPNLKYESALSTVEVYHRIEEMYG
jgi:hypothetical protein